MTAKPIPDAYRGATPYFIVSGAADAIEWYTKVFGAQELTRLADPAGKVLHAEIQIGAALLMLADEFPELGFRSPQSLGGSPVSLLLYVEDVDAVFARALAAGAKPKKAVEDEFDGDRRGTVVDPFGHVWLLATRQEDISREELATRFAQLLKSGA